MELCNLQHFLSVLVFLKGHPYDSTYYCVIYFLLPSDIPL